MARRPGRRQRTRYPLGARVCLDEDFYLHRRDLPGSAPGSHPPRCMAGVRVRCSQPRVSRAYQL